MKQYYVYILASQRNGTLYTGVTSDLIKRVWQHKSGIMKGFTSKYKVNQLVYYEIHNDIEEAIKREKNIQAWKRAWKLRLIEKKNPNWLDLYNEIVELDASLRWHDSSNKPDIHEALIDVLEDKTLTAIANAREGQHEQAIEVRWDDL